MPSPPLRYSRESLERTVLGTAIGALLLLVLPVAAQQAPTNPTPGTGLSLTAQAITSAVFTGVIGGLLVAVAPDYTERTTDRILQDPGGTFLYGLGIFVATIVVVFLLAITVIGLLLAIPIVIAMAVIGVLGYLAAGRVFFDDWAPALLVAAVTSAFTGGVPILGGLVGFLLGCVAFGAWYLEFRSDGSRSGGSSRGVDPGSGGASRRETTRSDETEEWGSSWNDGPSSGTAGDADATADDEWTSGLGDDADRE